MASSAASSPLIPYSQVEQLREARAIVRQEAEALLSLSQQIDREFCRAVDIITACSGCVTVTGMGKAGLVGRKISATLSSTGTRSQFLHPAEAVHGDLGCLHSEDLVLAISNSGETEEVCRLLPILESLSVPVLALTADERSTLGSRAEIVIRLGRLTEAGSLGLAPSTSTTAMLAVGDALALVVSRCKQFGPRDFARFHPAGSLGQQLQWARDVMRPAEQVRIASEGDLVRDVLVTRPAADAFSPGRRSGAIILVDTSDRLTGLFTDSDLARLLEQRRESQLDRPVSEVMTPEPFTVAGDTSLAEVIDVLSRHKFSELPVIDGRGRPLGMIDITDVIGLMPNEVTE
ncbi:MAG: KpsF/GutQ family sugar-phosphate isomerase [Planctomycetaceae bacterium]